MNQITEIFSSLNSMVHSPSVVPCLEFTFLSPWRMMPIKEGKKQGFDNYLFAKRVCKISICNPYFENNNIGQKLISVAWDAARSLDVIVVLWLVQSSVMPYIFLANACFIITNWGLLEFHRSLLKQNELIHCCHFTVKEHFMFSNEEYFLCMNCCYFKHKLLIYVRVIL